MKVIIVLPSLSFVVPLTEIDLPSAPVSPFAPSLTIEVVCVPSAFVIVIVCVPLLLSVIVTVGDTPSLPSFGAVVEITNLPFV